MVTTRESRHVDYKSLRKVVGNTANFGELAQDCVCFANGAGGTLIVGIEDGEGAPPSNQQINTALLDRVCKRIGELTVNVQVVPELKRHENGGEYVALTVERAVGVASRASARGSVRRIV